LSGILKQSPYPQLDFRGPFLVKGKGGNEEIEERRRERHGGEFGMV